MVLLKGAAGLADLPVPSHQPHSSPQLDTQPSSAKSGGQEGKWQDLRGKNSQIKKINKLKAAVEATDI